MEAAEDVAIPLAPGDVQDEVVLNFVSPSDSLSNANQPAEPASAFDQSGDDDHLWASSLGQDRGIFAWRTPATSRANAVGIPLVTDYATSTEDGSITVPSLPSRSLGASASPSTEAVDMTVGGNGNATDKVILQFVSPPSSPINPPARPTPTISRPREDHVIWAPSLGQGRNGIFSWRRSTPSLDLVPRGAVAQPVDSFPSIDVDAIRLPVSEAGASRQQNATRLADHPSSQEAAYPSNPGSTHGAVNRTASPGSNRFVNVLI